MYLPAFNLKGSKKRFWKIIEINNQTDMFKRENKEKEMFICICFHKRFEFEWIEKLFYFIWIQV